SVDCAETTAPCHRMDPPIVPINASAKTRKPFFMVLNIRARRASIPSKFCTEPQSSEEQPMNARRWFVCAATVASLVLPALSYGQTAQCGVGGGVQETTGPARPGVTVEAASPALIER